MITALPSEKVDRSVMPKLSMLTYFPDRGEAERKQLLALNDKLAGEAKRMASIVSILVMCIVIAFLVGLLIGFMTKVGG